MWEYNLIKHKHMVKIFKHKNYSDETPTILTLAQMSQLMTFIVYSHVAEKWGTYLIHFCIHINFTSCQIPSINNFTTSWKQLLTLFRNKQILKHVLKWLKMALFRALLGECQQVGLQNFVYIQNQPPFTCSYNIVVTSKK